MKITIHIPISVKEMQCLVYYNYSSQAEHMNSVGHSMYHTDTLAIKQVLQQLGDGPIARPVSRPKFCFKDTLKTTLKCGNELDMWQHCAHDRGKWRTITECVCRSYCN